MTIRSQNGSRPSKKKPASPYKKPGKIVKVEWEDAYKEMRWVPDPNKHNPLIVYDVGHVIFHDKRGIMIATSRTIEDDVGGRAFIPAGMIRKIKVLE